MMQVFQTAKRYALPGLALAAAMVATAGAQTSPQTDTEQHGRKYKPMPPTSHVVVTVVKGFNGKPLQNAAVIFHATRDGINDGNLEVKTDPDGKATIDVIEVGSEVNVQVIAPGFATSATEMNVDGPSKELTVKLLRPRAQVSTYQDNEGKPDPEKPGVQEPAHNVKQSASPAGTPVDPTKPTSIPVGNPTQLPGPLNAPPGTVTVPTQPGAPVTVPPPTAPTAPGTPTLPPQEMR
jgi:hypothetical protein